MPRVFSKVYLRKRKSPLDQRHHWQPHHASTPSAFAFKGPPQVEVSRKGRDEISLNAPRVFSHVFDCLVQSEPGVPSRVPETFAGRDFKMVSFSRHGDVLRQNGG